MDEVQAAARAEYEAALDWHTLARKELANARHLLELAEQNMDQAEAALAKLESVPGIPAYLLAPAGSLWPVGSRFSASDFAQSRAAGDE